MKEQLKTYVESVFSKYNETGATRTQGRDNP